MAAVIAGLPLLAGLSLVVAGAEASGPEFVEVQADLVVDVDGRQLRLRVYEFQLDAGSASVAVRSERLRAELLAGLPPQAGGGGVSAAFATEDYVWPTAAVTWMYNAALKPAGLADEVPELVAAANSWNGAGGSPFVFTYGGVTAAQVSVCPGAAGVDGVNTVGWGALTGDTLARTCVWFDSSKNAVEVDMQIDPEWDWTTSEPVGTDLFTVIAHEYGHALGLGHTGAAGECPGALMCATYKAGTTIAGPQADDIAGLVAIYGGTAPTATPAGSPSPSPSTEASATATPSSTPTATASPSPTASPTPITVVDMATLPLLARD